MTLGFPSRDQIRRRLRALRDEPTRSWHGESYLGEGVELTPAGVLIALTEIDGALHVVVTKRTDEMRKHAGQMSFPGGRVEPGDADTLEAALRESCEEVALHPDDVEVYGSFLTMPTITGYQVTAHVGAFEQPYELDPNPAEIAAIVEVPLEALFEPGAYSMEKRRYNEKLFTVHFFEYEGYVIWGVTGFIMRQFLDYLSQ
jgi:8-oxo-dGTP pyrophosphatase MutT (NUDIX family)